VKITIRPEHASMPAMDGWLAGLHDTESAEPAGPGNAEPGSPGNARPAGPDPGGPGYAVPASYAVPAPSPGHAVPTGPGYTMSASPGRAGAGAASARPQALTGPAASAPPAATAPPSRTTLPAALPRPAAPAGPAGAAARAVIGDQLRIPVMWCEMGSCVSWHADPAALGEADARARAIGAGWRIDAFGRLACLRCQQTHPGYRTACQAVPWDRSKATGTTAPMPVVPSNGAAGRAALRTSRDPGRAARGYPPPTSPQLEWHHDAPAGQATPAGTSRPRGLVFSARRSLRGARHTWPSRSARSAASSRSAATAASCSPAVSGRQRA
jgi:hypothetical protein